MRALVQGTGQRHFELSTDVDDWSDDSDDEKSVCRNYLDSATPTILPTISFLCAF